MAGRHAADGETDAATSSAEARQSIRAYRRELGTRTVALDDDPTGSQSVHDVSVVTALEAAEYAAALAEPTSTCFILTNTRSLDEADAVRLNRTVAHDLFRLEQQLGAPLDIVSRSDSTLRGHVIAEVRALDAARRDVLGRGFDGVLLAPAYFEAGRYTSDDVHWAIVGGEAVPAGETEFANDATFGYESSNLRDFVAEKSGGEINADQVLSIGLTDIREGGPEKVAEILGQAHDLQFIVVNATEFADLEIVVLGVQEAQRRGGLFLYRTGPSFVRALIGNEPIGTLTAGDIWPGPRPAGHGLVVVGSHVGQTARQVAVAQERGGVLQVELSVERLVDAATHDAHVDETASKVIEALAESDVMLFTSRQRVTGADAAKSLEIARTVSSAVVEIVQRALEARPAWVVAKGGITSHDVAVRGLGIRRATVLGQLFPGMVSVLRPEEAAEAAVGIPYVVFAGNVGDENALADVMQLFRGGAEG